VAQSTREFFETLEERVDPAKAAGMSSSYLFDIDGVGRWRVDVENGSAKVTEGGEDAACTISTSDETFQRIVAGELNPTNAYMTGKLKVAGDMAAALKLQNLF
jgi:putative sterol carrier protein